jgi:hypothetical protein
MDPAGASHPEWRLRSSFVIFDMLEDPRPGHGLLGVSDPDVHLVDGRCSSGRSRPASSCASSRHGCHAALG